MNDHWQTQKRSINIFWFKRDLRLEDNDALQKAISSPLPLILIYVWEPTLENDPHYSERHWRFVSESLDDLNRKLKSANTEILILREEVLILFELLTSNYDIQNVYSTEETGIDITYKRDIEFAAFCKKYAIRWHEFQNGGLIRGLKNRDTWRERWYEYMNRPIQKIDLERGRYLDLEQLPENIKSLKYEGTHNVAPKFQKGGRSEGKKWEESFFRERLRYYSAYISKPELSRIGCSRLSPYFAWGCISIREVYQRSSKLKNTTPYKKQLSAFRSRLRWQAHFIQKFEMESRIEFEAFNRGYMNLEQPVMDSYVEAWQSGTTGFPLVDASIRSVAETGYLNFRMRAMVVSFLTHHLFQHFTTGAHWLARQFLDFEPGIHYGQFQMQAGFTATNTLRVYNPTKNAFEHDPDATFIKRWVPELADLPSNLAIEPWNATIMEQVMYNFVPGVNYPTRIVNIEETRVHALKQLFDRRKDKLTQSEKRRILSAHTLKNRIL